MPRYRFKLYWKPDEAEPVGGSVPQPLQSTMPEDATAEAHRRWASQPYAKGPKGFLVLDDDNFIVYAHERAN